MYSCDRKAIATSNWHFVCLERDRIDSPIDLSDSLVINQLVKGGKSLALVSARTSFAQKPDFFGKFGFLNPTSLVEPITYGTLRERAALILGESIDSTPNRRH
jgi:hypothetical protein